VRSITFKGVLIKGTKETLVETKVEGLLVEGYEDRLSIITVINLDTWTNIERIHVPHAHIAKQRIK
jgi:hypothetical protein